MALSNQKNNTSTTPTNFLQPLYETYFFTDVRGYSIQCDQHNICHLYNTYFRTGCVEECTKCHLFSNDYIHFCKRENQTKPIGEDAIYAFKETRRIGIKDGNYTKAIRVMSRLLKDYPFNSMYHSKMGFYQQRLHDFDAAKWYYQKAISIKPHVHLHWFNAAILCIHYQQDYVLGEEYILNALDCWDKEPKSHALYAKLLHRHLGKFDEANHHFAISYDLNEADLRTKHNWSLLLMDMNEYHQARTLLSECIIESLPKCSKSNTNYWFLRSVCQEKLQLYHLAIQDIDTLMSVDPNNEIYITRKQHLCQCMNPIDIHTSHEQNEELMNWIEKKLGYSASKAVILFNKFNNIGVDSLLKLTTVNHESIQRVYGQSEHLTRHFNLQLNNLKNRIHKFSEWMHTNKMGVCLDAFEEKAIVTINIFHRKIKTQNDLRDVFNGHFTSELVEDYSYFIWNKMLQPGACSN